MSDPETNKQLVIDFTGEAAFGAGPEAAFEKYCSPSYKQHNPRLVDGKEGFLTFMRAAAACEGFTFNVKRMACEGDCVWIQAESTGFHWPDEPAPADPSALRHAWMDIFRVENGKIVEHWDVYQRIPPYTASGNPMV